MARSCYRDRRRRPSLPCTEYRRPRHGELYLPSLLDHVVMREGDWSAPEVLRMCAELACAATGAAQMHADYTHVSDHCPVRIRGDG